MTWMLSAASLVLLVALATVARVEARRRASFASHPPEGAFVSVGGHPVHYVQKGTGPDLVLIHGASGNTRDWSFGLLEPLTERYRVTVFDRPGLGYTPPLGRFGVTLDQQTDLLVGAARALGITDPVVAGQSYGGAIVMNWAVRHHDMIAAAVSISGATYPLDGYRDRFYAIISRPVIGPLLAWLIGAWVPQRMVDARIDSVFAPQDTPDGYGDHIGTGLILNPPAFVANARQRDDLISHLRLQSDKYPSLKLPIEVIHGTADDTVLHDFHSERLAREVDSAVFTPLPGVGHMPQHVRTADTIAAIDRAALRAGLMGG